MNNTDAIEQAYRNGYAEGVRITAEHIKERIRTMNKLIIYAMDIDKIVEKLEGAKMIALRTNPYNERELEKLADMLIALEIHLNNQVCKHGQCATCHYSHLCYDITSARKYAEKLCREKDRK